MTDPKAVLSALAGAIRAKDWAAVRAHLAPGSTWFVGGGTSLAGQHEGADAVVSLLEQVAAKAFDRPGMDADEAEILVGDHHHGLFWAFSGEIDGEKVWAYELWLAELDAEGRVGAVFTFGEDEAMRRRFWG